MPPQRSIPPSKAVKTERTHEENQERAYIAASRRSDRSLEARVESARRASEIHKRRTGRSLRVTEQDVVNEEMYEEEDDDLPMQYRRLTAHLQTGSADFNRRLSAYLTNHVAMRSALDQAITNSYAQQYPNAPHFPHNNHQTMYTSPFMAQNIPPQPSPQSYVQPSYNTATGTPSYRPVQHFRSITMPGTHGSPAYSHSIPTPSPVQGPNQLEHQRRMSMPSKSASPHYGMKQESQSPGQMQAPPPPPPHPHLQQRPMSNLGFQDFSPLTTSLPPESQQLLGGSLDPTDPLTSILMAGSEFMLPSFSPNLSAASKRHYPSSYDGMNATLAPSALDMSPRNMTNPPPMMPGANPDPSLPLCMDGAGPDFSKGQFFPRSNSSPGSGSGGTGTPIEAGWDAFINDSTWTDNVT